MPTKYVHFTDEQKEQARQTDLCELLRSQGEKLKRSGSEYEWMDGSQKVTIRGNLWFHQYDQQGGDAIDFVRRFYNKDYVSVIDLRNPTRSNGNNLLHLVNKYMDLYQANPDTLVYKAKAEKYAKIISKTIILSGMDAASFGQNAYFYDAAEGLLTATILLVAEFCKPEERHIVSVFKIIQELLAPSGKKGKNQFQQLIGVKATI